MNETGLVVAWVYGFVCVHVAHLQCVVLLCVTLYVCVCMFAGEDSEPGGKCGDNSGAHQPGNSG